MRYFIILLLLGLTVSSCYKLEDLTPNYEDGHSTIVYDLPGDTLATDGWEHQLENEDLFIRQRYYNSPWTDSIRFFPLDNELINGAINVNSSSENDIRWLNPSSSHPVAVVENDAYLNTTDNFHYIRRSDSWYQMEINVDFADTLQVDEDYEVNWRGFMAQAPRNPDMNWAYRNNRNNRVYVYNGIAWEVLVRSANYRNNMDFIEVQFSRSGKEAGLYSPLLFRFSDHWQHFLRDNADSLRYLRTDEWDLAFTGEFNGVVFLKSGQAKLSPASGSPLRHAIIMYEYGYDFMDEAPEDEFFDNRPADQMQITYDSQYGPGINSWFELGTTGIGKPFPYRAYYLRLQQPAGSTHKYLYGKLQLISMYKGAPEVLTDRNWPSPYMTFRYFIQKDGSRNLRTKD